jgi:hypothetical protein
MREKRSDSRVFQSAEREALPERFGRLRVGRNGWQARPPVVLPIYCSRQWPAWSFNSFISFISFVSLRKESGASQKMGRSCNALCNCFPPRSRSPSNAGVIGTRDISLFANLNKREHRVGRPLTIGNGPCMATRTDISGEYHR